MKVVAWLASVAVLGAQTTAGRIMGTIFDRTGAVVPGATVTAANAETSAQRTGVSNTAGQYLIYPLAPGAYAVTVEASGFKPARLVALRLEVAATVTRNFTLELGALEQQVTVSAEGAPALTHSMSVESAVVREQIEVLPLNGRDFNQLVLLAAGAVDNNVGGGTDFGGVAVNGNRSYSNDYLLDGAPNNNVFQGRSAAPVSIDVIREFKVTSGVAPAEYGQAGTQISVVTRGGTNRFHGNLFEYYRGNALQARDPFNTMRQQPFRRNQFGGSLGGPVRRNRTFFFFNYEGNRQTENVTRVATVPPEEFWKGDFSTLLARRIQLRDPLLADRPLIPGNRLDQYLGGARLSKAALALRPFFGSPTGPGLANNSLQFPARTDTGDQFTVRLDQMLPANQSLALRLTKSDTGGFVPNLMGIPGVGRDEPLDSRNGTLAWTAPFGSRTVNELRFGAMNFSDMVTYLDGGLPTVESLGWRGFEKGNPGIPPMPQITFTGTDAFTQLKYGDTATYGEAALSMISNIYTLSEALSHFRGKHNLKAGFEARRTDLNVLQQSNARGQITFRGASSGASSGYSFADFLMALAGSSQQVPVKPKILLRQMELASYIQDDWRVSSRLVLSFGLRHELFLSPYEERNRLAMFDPATGAIVVASDGGRLPAQEYHPLVKANLTDAAGNWRFPLLSDKEAGFTPRRLIETQYRHWGPRFGFVFQPDAAARMVVRGGYGIFYSRYPRQYLLQTVAVNPPFAGLFSYSQRIQDGRPELTLDAPYPGAGASASVSPTGLQRDFGLPDNQQWNLTIEREIGWGTVASLGYIGNKGAHLFRSINANGSYFDEQTGQVRRRYSSTYGTSTINFRRTDGNSIYNAMQLELRRRARKGLIFQGNWTWAKGIDDVGATVQAALLDIENLGRDRADSDYVRRHLVNVNAAWELPLGRGRAFLGHLPRWAEAAAGGWRLSGIWRYTTGRFLTPSFASTGGLNNNRPDVVAGVQANLPRGQRSASRWFNPAAFAEVPAVDPAAGQPRFGNAGRNILAGPGLHIFDANLAKSFRLAAERQTVTFRLEIFNLLNHPNYGAPDVNISNVNTVATINRVIRPMRQAQLALRFDF